MAHYDDNIALFVSFFNVSMCLDYLLERIAPVDDCFYLPYLDQFFEED